MSDEDLALEPEVQPESTIPEVAEVEAVVDDPQSESSPEAGDVETPEGQEDGDKPNRVQERINKITRDKYDAIRRADEAEAKAKVIEDRLAALENTTPTEPKMEDYRSDEEYIEAVKRHFTDVGAANASKPKEPAIGGNQVDELLQTAYQKITAANHIPGIKEMADDPTLPITRDSLEFLIDSDSLPEVVHHLGTHLDKAYEIMNMSPAQRFRELSKLESSLKRPEMSKQTSAPKPPSPIGASNGSPVKESELSMEEWAARRNAKIHGGS